VDWYFRRYGDLDLQRRMVTDHARTDAFARAIAEVVRPGDHVLELGTGTGVLAMLAARAGAARVTAVEASGMARTAADLAHHNGLADVISVYALDARELVLDRPADVLVSEWLGHLALVEGMLDDVVALRDRCLRPGGRMLPSHVSIYLAPIDDPTLYHRDGPGAWRRAVHGLDFAPLEALERAQGRTAQVYVDPSVLVGPPCPLVTLDLARDAARDALRGFRTELVVERDATLSGLVGWFDAELAPNTRLCTGPGSPATHWAQTYFPLEPRAVRAGQRLALDAALAYDAEEPRTVRVSIALDGGAATEFRVE
jgi:protein arginine N-methyltransferase 1